MIQMIDRAIDKVIDKVIDKATDKVIDNASDSCYIFHLERKQNDTKY